MPAWEHITSEPRLLSWIKGYKITFSATPTQSSIPNNRPFSYKEELALKKIIPELLSTGAITRCKPLPDQFISPIFLAPKPDGNFRLILNLKSLNKFIPTEHFKSEDYRVASKLITPSCFMAKLDLKNAYYLLAVHPLHRRFLRFYFNDKLFEFTCLPFGLASAPFVFTKIMRPVISLLRSKGFKSVNYLDDFLLLGPSERACVRNVMATCAVLFSLGFLFSAQKCRFPPSTCCEFLGFEFNSVSMRMSLPANKRSALARLINKMAKQRSCTIRQYAQFLGSLAAACPAITYSRLYTKKFERDKYLALLRAKGDFNAIMQLPPRESEFSWWRTIFSREIPPFSPLPLA